MIHSPVEIFAYTHTHTHTHTHIILFIHFWLCWVFLARELSPAVKSGSFSEFKVCGLLTVLASLVVEHGLERTWASAAAANGLSSGCSQAPEHKLNSCCSLSLVAPWHVGSPQLRMPYVSCPDRWYHWTTREAPMGILIQVELSYYHGL